MRTRMRRGAAAAAVSALCFTAAACGGSSDGDKAKEAPAPTPLTAAQMKAATLELGDLPTGWKVSKPEPTNDNPKADKPECQAIAGTFADKIAGATVGGDQEFEAGDKSLAQQVFTYPNSDGPTDFVKAISTALDTCKGFSFEMEGMKASVKTEKITAPKAGEEALAFRVKMVFPEMAEVKFEINVMVARQGAGATRVAHVPADASGHKDFDALAKLAGDKFTKAAQS
ncbi:hypothetical protein ACFO9E_18505 [Streptomyces maoxianensis]|uniref:Lipoprotein n=1 Tax=Streptomyces maoxianensis TaxID=1459942 RepID=A0ABV9G659_9ACTN